MGADLSPARKAGEAVPAAAGPVAPAMAQLGVFERYLTGWVALCMVAGVLLGKAAPGLVQRLRQLEFGSGSQVNVAIAVLIWLMIIPMMMRVDLAAVRKVGRRPRGRQAVRRRCRNVFRKISRSRHAVRYSPE